jgi:hypothetical protein
MIDACACCMQLNSIMPEGQPSSIFIIINDSMGVQLPLRSAVREQKRFLSSKYLLPRSATIVIHFESSIHLSSPNPKDFFVDLSSWTGFLLLRSTLPSDDLASRPQLAFCLTIRKKNKYGAQWYPLMGVNCPSYIFCAS